MHFVRDHRPSVGKLDPRAVKCIFVGYSSSQKGYKCWCPTERRLFISMDMTFRESEPYYGEKADLSPLFELDDLSINQDGREGENHDVISSPIEQNQRRMEAVIAGSTPQPRMETMTSDLDPTPCQEDSSVRDDPRYKGPLRVYKRRMRTSREEVPGITPESATPQEIVDVSPTSSTEIEESGLDDLPIALRKEPRAKAGMPPPRYGFEHDISNYVSYASLSPAYRAFVASLQSVVIPKDWKEAK